MTRLKKEMGELAVVEVLILAINDLQKFFSVGKKMDGNQILETAELIMTAFTFLTIEDVKLCFKNIKMQKYGKDGQTYDSIDGGLIMRCMHLYFDDRTSFAETNTMMRNKKLKEAEFEHPKEEFFQETVLPFINSLVQKVPDKELPPQTSDQRLVNRWYSQFDVLFERIGIKRGSTHYLRIGTKNLNLKEFIDLKFLNRMNFEIVKQQSQKNN